MHRKRRGAVRTGAGLVATEDERFVFLDWSTRKASNWLRLNGEQKHHQKVPGVQRTVTEEFENASV